MNKPRIAVITKIPDQRYDGNKYDEIVTAADLHAEDAKHAPPNFLMSFKKQLFRLGEILLLDHNDRDIEGPDSGGRKPSKWWVEYETFSWDEMDKALERALEVRRMGEGDPRTKYPADELTDLGAAPHAEPIHMIFKAGILMELASEMMDPAYAPGMKILADTVRSLVDSLSDLYTLEEKRRADKRAAENPAG